MMKNKQFNIQYYHGNINYEDQVYSQQFNPLRILQISDTQNARTYDCIQTKEIKRYQKSKTYQNSYSISQIDLELYALSGNLPKLKRYVNNHTLKNLSLQFSRTLLYTCCRSGYYDCVQFLLEIGSDVNQQQENFSTPLHVAAYYGHENIVSLLISYGSSTKIRNQYHNLPSCEAATNRLRQFILDSDQNKINQLFQELKTCGTVSSIEISQNKQIIRIYKKGIKRELFFDYYLNKNYRRSYHGTQFKFLKSIITHGLKKPGERIGDLTVNIRDGHVQKGVSLFGKDNWSDAIFVSPSPLYAAENAYAERITSESESYCCLVEAFVKDGTFITAPSTIFQREFIAENEPVNVEYAVAKNTDSFIYRVQDSQNVVVYSILFLKVKFLENDHQTFEECLNKIQFHKII